MLQGKKLLLLLIISLAVPLMAACSANWQLSEEIHGTIGGKNPELDRIVINYEHENGEPSSYGVPIERITNQDKELDQYHIGQEVLLEIYTNEEARNREEDIIDHDNRKYEIIEK